MRPSTLFAVVVFMLATVAVAISIHGRQRAQGEMGVYALRDNLTREIGLTDICLATEARYTRHPAVTDDIAPFMDYPAAQEHFPTGLFWAPR